MLAALNDPQCRNDGKLKVAGVGTTLDRIAVDTGVRADGGDHHASLVQGAPGSRRSDTAAPSCVCAIPPTRPHSRAAVDAMAPNEKIVYQTLAGLARRR